VEKSEVKELAADDLETSTADSMRWRSFRLLVNKTVESLIVVLVTVVISVPFRNLEISSDSLPPPVVVLVDFIGSQHWSTLVCLSALIYPFFGALVDLATAGRSSPTSFIPAWSQLRSFGDQRVAKASYAVMLLIPIAAYLVIENPFNLSQLGRLRLPLNVKLGYFSSLSFSLALLGFATLCPASFRRHEVAGSNKGGHSRALQLNELIDNERLLARSLIFAFYVLGIVLGIIVIIRSAQYVASA
jgi:hypothetical protein